MLICNWVGLFGLFPIVKWNAPIILLLYHTHLWFICISKWPIFKYIMTMIFISNIIVKMFSYIFCCYFICFDHSLPLFLMTFGWCVQNHNEKKAEWVLLTPCYYRHRPDLSRVYQTNYIFSKSLKIHVSLTLLVIVALVRMFHEYVSALWIMPFQTYDKCVICLVHLLNPTLAFVLFLTFSRGRNWF